MGFVPMMAGHPPDGFEWPWIPVWALVELAIGVGFFSIGLYSLFFPDSVFIESVGESWRIVISIACMALGAYFIRSGWRSYLGW